MKILIEVNKIKKISCIKMLKDIEYWGEKSYMIHLCLINYYKISLSEINLIRDKNFLFYFNLMVFIFIASIDAF